MQKKYLMTPGPTSVPTDVLLAQARDVIHHRAPAYAEVLREITARLKKVLGTEGDVVIFGSSGTGAMESSVVNLFSPGDKVVVISVGYFGDRYAAIAEEFGLQVIKLSYQWGSPADPLDLERTLESHPETKGVFITHLDTSTGVENDLEAFGRVTDPRNVALIVDSISGLGSSPLYMDVWNLDVVVSGSQKALMTPPGIAFAGISSRAWNMVERSRLPKFYWSYQKSKDAYNKPIAQNPFTPPVSLLVAFNEALKMAEREGLENMWSRHRLLAEATRGGLRAMGLKLFATGGWGNGVTSVLPPEGVDGGKIVRMMREDFGITIAGGQGDLKGKIFRIGHLGYVDRLDIILTLAALEMTLARLGVEVELGSGVRGAQEVFLKAER